jgi:hypothetical protein
LYCPGSVRFDLGRIIKRGYVPVMKPSVLPKSRYDTKTLSSESGSTALGSLKNKVSPTFSLTFYGYVINSGGPRLTTMIFKGTINVDD